MTTVVGSVRRWFDATDPGRYRLTSATVVSLGVLISSLAAWAIVHVTKAEFGLLAIGAFLALQISLGAKDRTARDRLVTTALMAVPILASMGVAALLAGHRGWEVTVFIAIAGVATWARRFGLRASAIGTMSFYAYFSTLALKITAEHLFELLLVAAAAIASVLLVRIAVLGVSPRHQIVRMIKALRVETDAATVAARSGDEAELRRRVTTIDRVGASITDWQSRYATEHYIDCGAVDFARLVLSVRIDVEQACAAIIEHGETDDVAVALAERADRSWAALAAVDLEHGRPTDAEHGRPTDPAPAPVSKQPAPAKQPDLWNPANRMVLQVVVATALAAIVGELISASRWYWAVLSAFVVFLGAATRGAILTRASHRLLGTVAGVIVGLPVAILVDSHVPTLIALAVVGVFGALYFGPVKYPVQAFFVTVVFTGLYGLLGLLNLQILELRVAETAAGALVGVACGYLLFATSSRAAVMAEVDAYFDALDRLLQEVRNAATDRGAATPVLMAVKQLDAASAKVDAALGKVTVSLLLGRRSRTSALEQLMTTGTRIADRVGRTAVVIAEQPSGDDTWGPRLERAVDRVLVSGAAARAALGDGGPVAASPKEPAGFFAAQGDSPEAEMITALGQLDWVLRRTVGAPDGAASLGGAAAPTSG